MVKQRAQCVLRRRGKAAGKKSRLECMHIRMIWASKTAGLKQWKKQKRKLEMISSSYSQRQHSVKICMSIFELFTLFYSLSQFFSSSFHLKASVFFVYVFKKTLAQNDFLSLWLWGWIKIPRFVELYCKHLKLTRSKKKWNDSKVGGKQRGILFCWM